MKKRPFNWGSWVNPPLVFSRFSKYLITKDPLTLPKGQTFCDSSSKTDPMGARSKTVDTLHQNSEWRKRHVKTSKRLKMIWLRPHKTLLGETNP